MKKALLLCTLVFCSLATFAQTLTFGIKAGVNFAKEARSEASLNSYSTQSVPGFHIAGLVDIGFNSFSIQPGLLFSTKGGKFTFTGYDSGITFSGVVKQTLNYLELPVNLLYKVPAGPGKLFFGAGPYLGYALSGKENVDSSDHLDITFGNDIGETKRMDYGINFLAGYQMTNGLSINANFGSGLTNLEGGSQNGSIKNEVIGVSLGYFFK